jgi:hypothetical protein
MLLIIIATSPPSNNNFIKVLNLIEKFISKDKE